MGRPKKKIKIKLKGPLVQARFDKEDPQISLFFFPQRTETRFFWTVPLMFDPKELQRQRVKHTLPLYLSVGLSTQEEMRWLAPERRREED